MFPLALAMVAEEFPVERIAPSQGLVAAMFAVGSAFGPVGGLYLIQTFGWQVAYSTLILPAALMLILGSVWMPPGHRGTGEPVDYAAAGLLGGGVAFFLLAITLGPDWDWGVWTPAELKGIPFGIPVQMIVATICIVAFFERSLRVAYPLIDLRRLRERNIFLAYTGAILVGLAMFTAFVVIPVLVDFPIVGLGLTLIDFGLLSIPTTVTTFLAAPIVGRGVARYGPRPMVLLGSALSGLGFTLLLEYHVTFLQLVVDAVPTFVGLITLLVSLTNVIALSVHRGDSGVRMGLSEMFQDLGASIDPVVVASILATFTRVVFIPTGGVIPPQPVVVPSAFAFDFVLGIGVAICVVTWVIGAFLRNYVVSGTANTLSRPNAPAKVTGPGPKQAGERV
jgi:MFS family permease